MDSIEQYFQEEYIIEKNRIKEIEDLLHEVIKTFSLQKEINGSSEEKKDSTGIIGWPYEIEDQKPLVVNSFSYSTNSMILFVISKLLDKIKLNSPIIPYTQWELDWKKVQELKDQTGPIKDSFIDYYSNNKLSLIRKCKENIDNGDVVFSNSFGYDDPFTLSWIVELMVEDPLSFSPIKDKFIDICIKLFNTAFNDPNTEILKFKKNTKDNKDNKPQRESSNHIFPLLRVIHLYKTISENIFSKNDGNNYLSEIKKLIHTKLFENLQNRINQQISYSVLQNSLFDTAELVLSIEGIILIDDKKRVDENLLTKVFEILKTNQKNNLYWRPLKPFVTSPQGDILLPLSIEIANSLLRICKHLEKKKKYYFHEFFEIFENYTKWLLSNVSQCTIGNDDYKGWRSEHVQKLNVIHPWETAQVVTYLMNYKSMLEDRIAYKSLKKSGLSCREKDKDVTWNEKWDVVSELGFKNCYKEIQDNFINPRNGNSNIDPQFSMLLYGPPGTGKSSIAEDLANVLNWRLITITPSDFIKHGEADIEGRAKSIFKTLEEQKNCVILFDEIDRLILDRDSNYYTNQADFYQFMTPSMLVKIKDLRTKEKSIFIIATNYEERIDSAIKRSGRIDEKYLVNTLNLDQREKNIKRFLKKEKEKKGIEIDDKIDLKKISSETVLFTYIELETLVKNACKKVIDLNDDAKIIDELDEAIKREEPTIKLLNYKRRFQSEIEVINGKEENIVSSIFPYKEFLTLVFLKLESGKGLQENEKELLERVLKCDLEFKLEKKFNSDSEIYKMLEPICKIL